MEKKTKPSKISFKGLKRVFNRDRRKKGVESPNSKSGNSSRSSIPSSAINTRIAISATETDKTVVPTPSVSESGGDVQAMMQVLESEEKSEEPEGPF